MLKFFRSKYLAYLSILLMLCLGLPSTGNAMRRGTLVNDRVTVASGVVTLLNTVIVLTNGVASVDFTSATVPRNYQGCLLQVRDSAGRLIQGFVYTNGTGTAQNIVLTKGGTTRNWTTQDGSFNIADTSGYTYAILRTLPVIVATGSILANQAMMDTTATNSFVAPVGLDLSAYQTGTYAIALYQATKMCWGYISATAPAGETSTELITNGTFETDTGSWTNYNNYWTTFERNTTSPISGTGDLHLAVTVATGYASLSQQIIAPVGSLVRNTFNAKEISGGVRSLIGNSVSYGNVSLGCCEQFLTGAGVSAYSSYGTLRSTNPYFMFCVLLGTSNEMYGDDVSVLWISDPASTGAQIVAADKVTRSFVYNSGVDPNASFSRVDIIYVGQ